MKPLVVHLTLAKHWGAAVAERRRRVGLTQGQLAELCQVTQQTISKIEAGGMIPHDRLKLVIANRLGVGPGKLFAWPPAEMLAEAAS